MKNFISVFITILIFVIFCENITENKIDVALNTAIKTRNTKHKFCIENMKLYSK